MNEISKEERTKQHILKLEKRISELAADCRKNKWVRTKITFSVLSVVVYFIALQGDIINSTAELFGWLIFAPLIAIGIMCVSYAILAYIIDGVKKDIFAIGEMTGRKDALELSKLNKE